MSTDRTLLDSIRYAGTKLGIENVRANQESALLEYLRNRDVFVSLETGGGKSFIFQAAPICRDYLKGQESSSSSVNQKSLAIVVSPITALIEDQISHLTKKNIHAIHLHRPHEDDPHQWDIDAAKIANGEISVVYTSPETLTTKRCRDLLSRRNVRENICGLFVDESHCIYKW